ncbi:hypothetical protein PLEOSDRAFT_1104187 [Pleurotus ostreatus PC15]|uniref:Major facilitator superfamily (MFS) profile domain-containing protein n=1 Tax=Pleurotus ostreatus (strain PC15) TaxID=1137138 RepID=A0A067NI20_PLEO1|nr:hypothetical protein PLEOSDRAFT_1104187 [Pleurotus ostreatus PC15]
MSISSTHPRFSNSPSRTETTQSESSLSSEKVKDNIKDTVQEVLPAIKDVEATRVNYDDKERSRILRKMDLRLLPFVSLLYLLSFLDRSNIGNARVAGMAEDLNLVGLKYNVAAAVFSIPYALVEVPSYVAFTPFAIFKITVFFRNIALKLVRPSIWIPSIMLAWGIIMTLMCLVNSYAGLIVARLFLGVAEAGLFPGITFYLSHWYPRRKFAMRIAIFFSAATIAVMLSKAHLVGSLHSGLRKWMGGLHGWQWIFCLEGLATVVVATLSYFFMYDYPETASFLTESERRHVVEMLKEDSRSLATGFDKKYIFQAMTDYKTYAQIGIHMGLLITAYSISLFAPTIVHQLGFSSAQAQLLTVPIFACGCCSTVVIGILSDKFNIRGPFIIGCALVSMVGYIVLYTTSTPGAGYVGCIIAAVGVFPTVPVDLAWIGGNVGGTLKRGVAIAMVIGMGNLGGLCSAFIYFDGPRFHHGHGTIMGWLGLSILLTCFMMYDYDRCNKVKEALCQSEGIDESHSDAFAELGDHSPLFRSAHTPHI